MKITILLLAVLALLSGVNSSHFRGTFISWQITSGRTVQFTISHAWRADGWGGIGLYFGDGGYVSFSATSASVTFASTDLAGEGYTTFKYVTSHTYASDGPFKVYFSDCCRISTLKNSADSYFQVTTMVDLRKGYSSPIASIPPLLQLPISATASYQIGVADPKGLGYTCSLTTNANSMITSTATVGGNAVSVTSDCNLVWNTAAGTVGSKYAVSITVAQDGTSTTIPLDFIIELVNSAQKPTCSVSYTGTNQVVVGQTWTASITGTTTRTGISSLKMSALGLASDATLSPVAGSSGAIPFTVVLTAKPTAAGAYSTSIVFTDSYNTQTSCAVAYQVVEPKIDCSVLKFTACSVKSSSLTAAVTPAPDSYSWRSNCSGSFDSTSSSTVVFTSNDGPSAPCKISVDMSKSSVVSTCSITTSCPLCASGTTPCRNDQPAVYKVSDPASIDKYVLGDVLATATDPDGAIVSATAVTALPPGVSLSPSGQFYVSNTALLDDGTYSVTVTTYDAAGGVTTQVVVIVLLQILCGTGLQSCGYACYDPNVHSCISFDGHRHLCLKGQLICSFQDNCCYDPLIMDCFNGSLCPKGSGRCNGQCYDPVARDCVTKANGVDQLLCLKGFQTCGDDCYDPVASACIGGKMCLKSEQVCGGNCYNPTSADCLNGMLVPKGYQQCGPTIYDPAAYGCWNGHTMCPVGTSLCGTYCYSTTAYSCKADFTLCPYKYEKCGGACYDEDTYTCCDPATDRYVLKGQAC